MHHLMPFESFLDRLFQIRRRLTAQARNILDRNGMAADAIRDWFEPFPSEHALRKVLEVAYFASLEFDEGRKTDVRLKWEHPGIGQQPIFPTCVAGSFSHLVFPDVEDATRDRETYVIEFDTPVDISSPRSLCKLAQITSDRSSLKLVEDQDDLKIAGVISAGAGRINSDSRRRFFHDAMGVSIVIRDPGHIEYHEQSLHFSYRKGNMRRLRPFSRVPAVREWIQEVDTCFRALLPSERPAPLSIAEFLSVEPFLSVVLHELDRARQGGMIVVLPPQAGPHFRIRFAAKGQTLRECITTAWNEKSSIDAKSRQLWRTMQEVGLFHFATHVACLSHMDGAIVLSREFDVLGIGAVLNLDGHVEEISTPRDVSSAVMPTAQSSGTRHLAARQICERVPGSIAFVVSQDGGLLVCASTPGGVVSNDDLCP